MDCQSGPRGLVRCAPVNRTEMAIPAWGFRNWSFHPGELCAASGDASLGVVLEPELRRIRLSLIGSTDTTLHLVLHAIECRNLDQRLVFSPLDSAVQPR